MNYAPFKPGKDFLMKLSIVEFAATTFHPPSDIS